MPIKNLTDQNSRSLDKGMPLLGRIYKGAARTDEDLKKNRPGKDLDHFRVEFEPQYEHLRSMFEMLYGTEPAQLPDAYLPGERTDDVLETWREEWAKGGLVHRCDGEEQSAWFDRSQGKVVYTPAPCAQSCQCRIEGRLMVMLKGLTKETGVIGKFMLKTHSIHDVLTLTNVLSAHEKMYGSLRGVRFVAGRVDKAISIPEVKGGQPTGNRITITKSVITLRVDEESAKAYALLAFNTPDGTHALPEPDAPRQLTAPEPDKLGPQWTEDDVKDFVRMYRAKTFSDSEVLGALQVERFMQWQGSLEQAITALEQWHNDQLA